MRTNGEGLGGGGGGTDAESTGRLDDQSKWRLFQEHFGNETKLGPDGVATTNTDTKVTFESCMPLFYYTQNYLEKKQILNV